MTVSALAVVMSGLAGGVAWADHEELHEGGYSDAQISTDQGEPGTVIEVSGTCQFKPDIPATDVNIVLSQRQEPWYSTSKLLPVEPDSTFSGELVVPVDAPVDDYRLSVTCFADDQAFGTHDFDFEVLEGPPNPNWFEVSPESGPPGTTITITGVCMFTPDEPGDYAQGRLQGPSVWVEWEAPIGDNGDFEGTVVVPDDASPGVYGVPFNCVADDQHYSDHSNPSPEFVVTTSPTTTTASPATTATTTETTEVSAATPTTHTGPQLPATGGSSPGAIALLLVIASWALMVVLRVVEPNGRSQGPASRSNGRGSGLTRHV